MPDSIKERITNAADACIKAHAAWDGNEQDKAARNALLEAIHELRRVTARLEIDIAHSESGSRPNAPHSHGNDTKKPQAARKAKPKKEDNQD